MKNKLKIMVLSLFIINTNTQAAIKKITTENIVLGPKMEVLSHTKEERLLPKMDNIKKEEAEVSKIVDQAIKQAETIQKQTQINSSEPWWRRTKNAITTHLKKYWDKYITGGVVASTVIIMGKMINDRNEKIKKLESENLAKVSEVQKLDADKNKEIENLKHNLKNMQSINKVVTDTFNDMKRKSESLMKEKKSLETAFKRTLVLEGESAIKEKIEMYEDLQNTDPNALSEDEYTELRYLNTTLYEMNNPKE